MNLPSASHHPAIALSTVRHKDGVSILRIFSREHGIVGCLVREGVKGGRRSRHLHAPLALLGLVGMRHIKEDLYRYDRAERLMPQVMTTAEVPRSAVAMFLAECTLRTFDSGTAHGDVFDALWRAAIRVEQAEGIGRIHLSFLAEAVSLSGLKPDAAVKTPSGMERFNLATAEWESGAPMGEDYLSASEAESFLRIQGMDFDGLQAEVLSHDTRNQLVLQHVRYLQLHLSTPRPLRSWEVLRTVLAED